MLLTQQLEEVALPHAEAGVGRTLLEKGSALRGASTRQIAAAAYTTPATLVRLGQRRGYEGWADFFEAYLEERDYIWTVISRKSTPTAPLQWGMVRR